MHIAVFILLLGCVSPSWAEAVKPSHVQTLVASDGAKHDWFGWSVQVDGDYAIVGAPYHDQDGSNTGAAYVYLRKGARWEQQAILTAPNPVPGSQFGQAVSLSGNRVLIGAPFSDDHGPDSGSAYLFERRDTTWQPIAKWTASDAKQWSEFGCSVAIHGDRAVVGAQVQHDKDDEGNQVSGAVYFFQPVDQVWRESGRFADFEATRGGQLGHAVAMGERFAFAAGDTLDGVGAVYVFERAGNGWKHTSKLKATDPGGFDTFGCSLAVSGNDLIVGAQFDDDRGRNSGSAYAFHYSDGPGWLQTAKLTAADGSAGDLFGCSVSISGGLAAVGAKCDNGAGRASGSIYLFDREGATWKQAAKVTAPDGAIRDNFGVSVSLGGTTILVGAHLHDTRAFDSGSAYVFERK